MASPNEYTATASQTTFTYDFQIFADSEIQVYKRAAGTDPDDTTDLLTLTTDYTVTGAGNAGGGTIVLTTGATVGDIVTLVSNISVSRLIEYQTNSDMLAATVNTDFDRIYTLISQELGVTNNRYVKFADSEQRSSNTNLIPTPENNKALGWNASGELANLTLSSASTDTDIDVIVGSGDARKPLVVNEAENGWEMGLKSGYTAGGTADAITITTDSSLSAYNSNEIYWIDIQSANTGAATLNVDSLGVKNIKLPNGNNPSAGQLAAGMVAGFWYDGTNFTLVNPATPEDGTIDTTQLTDDCVTDAKVDHANLAVPALLSTTSITNSASMDLATAFSGNSGYEYFMIQVDACLPEGTNTNKACTMRLSVDGSTFDTGASYTDDGTANQTSIALNTGVSDYDDELNLVIKVYRPHQDLATAIQVLGMDKSNGGVGVNWVNTDASYEVADAVTGFQLLMADNFAASGSIKVWGCNAPVF